MIVTFFLLFLPPLWNAIINLLDALGQDKIANDYSVLTTKSANVLRTLVRFVPTAIVIWKFRVLKEKFPDIEPLVVMNLFATALSFFMLRNAIFARFVSLVDVSTVFLLPKIPYAFIRDVRYKRSGELVLIGMIVLYFVYMVLLIRSGDSHLYPYQFLPDLDTTWY